jgi:hypothetical protein
MNIKVVYLFSIFPLSIYLQLSKEYSGTYDFLKIAVNFKEP